LVSRLIRLIFPPDPGGLRLYAALRATLAGLLTFSLVLLAGSTVGFPVGDRILGFAIALFIAANVRDATRRQRLATIAIAILCAAAGSVLALSLLDWPFGAAAVVPVLMFATAYGASRNPRYASIGVVALIAYFISLLTHASADTLPSRLIVLALAAVDVVLVREFLLPERPLVELKRLRHATQAQIDRVLSRIAAAVSAGAWNDAARDELGRDVDRLHEIVMMAQTRAAGLAAQLPAEKIDWLHLLVIELCVERAARVGLEDLGPPQDRAPVLAIIEALQNGRSLPPRQFSGQLADALDVLGHALHEAPRAGPSSAAAPPAATGAQGLRPALQTGIAVALAVMAGSLLSGSRWYWAAFAAFSMFQGTRSRGESIAKGVNFMAGTLAGVVVGMLTATLIAGHEILSLVLVVVAVFLAFQANVVAYGAMMFWITIILGLLFGMLGYFTPDVLLLRLQETAVGAACGALVASLVLVRRDRAATRDATIAFLEALRRAVDGAAVTLLDGTAEPDLAARILAAEQRFHDLSAIARVQQQGLASNRNESLRRRVVLLGACEQWAVELGQMGLQSARISDPALVGIARTAAARIDATVRLFAARLADHSAMSPTTEEPAGGLGKALESEESSRAVRLLLRIDAVLLQMASR
jgi:uncharacterized membrane protein YccC